MCNPPFCYPTLGRFTPLRDLRFFHSCDNILAAISFKISTHLDLPYGIIHSNFGGFILHWAGNTGVRTPQKVENFGYFLGTTFYVTYHSLIMPNRDMKSSALER